VATRVLHPAVILPIYGVAMIIVAGYFSSQGVYNNFWEAVFISVLAPQTQFTLLVFPVLQQWSKKLHHSTNWSSRPLAICICLRCTLLLALMWGLQLPNGFGMLQGETGRGVWTAEFMNPALYLIQKTWGSTNITLHITIGSAVYQGVLAIIVITCVPCYLLVLMALLFFSDGLRGNVDESLTDDFYKGCEDVVAWSQRRVGDDVLNTQNANALVDHYIVNESKEEVSHEQIDGVPDTVTQLEDDLNELDRILQGKQKQIALVERISHEMDSLKSDEDLTSNTKAQASAQGGSMRDSLTFSSLQEPLLTSA